LLFLASNLTGSGRFDIPLRDSYANNFNDNDDESIDEAQYDNTSMDSMMFSLSGSKSKTPLNLEKEHIFYLSQRVVIKNNPKK